MELGIPRPLRDFLVRFAMSACVLLVAGHYLGDRFVSFLLPAVASSIETIDGRFRVDRIAVVERRSIHLVELSAAPVHAIVFGGSVVVPGNKLNFEPSTLVGSFLQPLIVFFSVLLAWPYGTLRTATIRCALSLPIAAIVLVVVVPLGLIGAMLDVRPLFPDSPVPWLVHWNDFLQSGGPLALGMSAAALVVAAEQRLSAHRTRPA